MLRCIQALICMALASGATAALALEPAPRAEMAAEAPKSGASIGRLNPGNGAYCTGVLVARNAVITAAHCLMDPRSKRWVRPESLHFLGGYRAGEYDFHARVARYTVSPRYDPADRTRHLTDDWAVLVLTEAAPATSPPMRLRAPDDGEVLGEVTGYAMQRKYAQSTSAPCRVRLYGPLLLGECQAMRGMSGGPLIEISSGEMIGMQVASGKHKGREVLVAIPTTSWRTVLDKVR